MALAQSPGSRFLLLALAPVAVVPMLTTRATGLLVGLGLILAVYGVGMLVLVTKVRLRILCWTDRSLVVFRSGVWRSTPKELEARLPRSTRIGPLRGLWTRVRLGDEELVVHRRFRHDVARAEGTETSGAGVA